MACITSQAQTRARQRILKVCVLVWYCGSNTASAGTFWVVMSAVTLLLGQRCPIIDATAETLLRPMTAVAEAAAYFEVVVHGPQSDEPLIRHCPSVPRMLLLCSACGDKVPNS